MLKFILLFSLGVASLQGAPALPSRSNAVPQVKLENRELESTNRVLLLKPKVTTRPVDIEIIRRLHNLKDETKTKRLKWKQFLVPHGQSKREIVSKLKASGLFEHVIEPKTYTTQETIPNDPMFPSLWGMTNISAPAAWDRIKDAPDVVVAVVDTGIDFTHPDLVDNLWTGPNGEHGYVATNGVVIAGGHDDHGHGTHVAGTIGAVGNNSVGVVGLAWRTRIMAMKVLHHGSGNSIDIVNGYVKLVELKESGVPVLVSNHSYGSNGPDHGNGADHYMEDGFKLLTDSDIFAAVAAGNTGNNIDIDPLVPAAFPFDNMVVALATDPSGKKASFSSFGLVGTDISAPGVGILSTTRSNSYSSFSGTSMASPHVAGLAALVRQLNRNLTASQTREAILHPGSYDPDSYLSSTGGKVNAAKTVNNPKLFEQPFQSNHAPRIESVTSYTRINNTQPLEIKAIASDADGDSLKWSTSLGGLGSSFEKQLLDLSGFYVRNTSNQVTVSGGPYAYQLASHISFGVSDQRGASAITNTGFEFQCDLQFRNPIPVKTWTVATNAESTNLVTITFDVADDAKTNYLYGLIINFPDTTIWKSFSWVPSPTPFHFSLNHSSQAFSIRVFVMDKWLNHLTTETISYPSNSTTLPKCIVTVRTNESNVPFGAVFDMSKSERATSFMVLDLFDASVIISATVQFNNPGMYFKMPLVFGTAPGEIDLTVVPVFASRFLDAAPPSRTANLTIYKAPAVTGPWAAFTNFTDTITGPEQFYRLEAR